MLWYDHRLLELTSWFLFFDALFFFISTNLYGFLIRSWYIIISLIFTFSKLNIPSIYIIDELMWLYGTTCFSSYNIMSPSDTSSFWLLVVLVYELRSLEVNRAGKNSGSIQIIKLTKLDFSVEQHLWQKGNLNIHLAANINTFLIFWITFFSWGRTHATHIFWLILTFYLYDSVFYVCINCHQVLCLQGSISISFYLFCQIWLNLFVNIC